MERSSNKAQQDEDTEKKQCPQSTNASLDHTQKGELRRDLHQAKEGAKHMVTGAADAVKETVLGAKERTQDLFTKNDTPEHFIHQANKMGHDVTRESDIKQFKEGGSSLIHGTVNAAKDATTAAKNTTLNVAHKTQEALGLGSHNTPQHTTPNNHLRANL
jgi:calcineurin-like phosphoesterase family protein